MDCTKGFTRTALASSSDCGASNIRNRNATESGTKARLSGEYVLDLVVQNGLIVDTKTMSASRITNEDNVELPPHYWPSSWIDPEFQVRAA